jgi:hypothetical protein
MSTSFGTGATQFRSEQTGFHHLGKGQTNVSSRPHLRDFVDGQEVRWGLLGVPTDQYRQAAVVRGDGKPVDVPLCGVFLSEKAERTAATLSCAKQLCVGRLKVCRVYRLLSSIEEQQSPGSENFFKFCRCKLLIPQR